MKKLLCTLLAILMLAGVFAACTKEETPKGTENTADTENVTDTEGENKENEEKELTELWKNATYTENTSLGEGKTTITLDVVADGHTVTFTLKTDKTVLGDVLKDNSLVVGEEGAYGLFINSVIGIEASWEKDQAYWNVTKNGEMLMTGVDGVTIANGEKYELTYTK